LQNDPDMKPATTSDSDAGIRLATLPCRAFLRWQLFRTIRGNTTLPWTMLSCRHFLVARLLSGPQTVKPSTLKGRQSPRIGVTRTVAPFFLALAAITTS